MEDARIAHRAILVSSHFRTVCKVGTHLLVSYCPLFFDHVYYFELLAFHFRDMTELVKSLNGKEKIQ